METKTTTSRRFNTYQQLKPNVDDLPTLIEQLKNMHASTTSQAFDNLINMVGSTIRVKYEAVKNTTDTTKGENTNDGGNTSDINELPSDRSKFAHLNSCVLRRIILTNNKKAMHTNTLLERQCNGVVLEYPSWKVLAVPMHAITINGRIPKETELSNYSVYAINDGTTVTMYHYDGKWCLSSANGFNVSDYQWIGSTTYWDALSEVLANYPDFSWDKLDKNLSYTIGFCHKDFQPLPTNKQRAWFVQSCDLSALNTKGKLSINYESNIGIPNQTPVQMPEGDHAAWLHDSNASALTSYTTSIHRSEQQVPMHYGWILRHNDGTSSLMFESTLLTKVRQLMYNMPKKNSLIVLTTPRERLEYLLLKSYLNTSTRFTFIELFPQFSPRYAYYEKIFERVVSLLTSALKNKSIKMALKNNTPSKKSDGDSIIINGIASSFIGHIEINVKMTNIFDTEISSIIRDFVVDSRYTDVHFKAIVMGSVE